MDLDIRILVEPQQGASYDDLLAVATETERLGFSGFFRSDHFVAMGGGGHPGPMRAEIVERGPSDAWVSLGGLAREVPRIRLGTLVSSVTFRHPGLLAVQVAQVDAMSGGRVECGLGAGWYEREHRAYGVPFPTHRFDLLEEQLQIVTGLLSTPRGESFDHEGPHYRLEDSPALPKPVQKHVPIIVGGGGARRTPALVARYADEYNSPFADPATGRTRVERVRSAADEAGRDPSEIVCSAAVALALGRTEREAASRAAAVGNTLESVREKGVGGTAQEAIDRLGAYAEAGFGRIYLQLLDLDDLDQLELFAAEVLPAVSGAR